MLLAKPGFDCYIICTTASLSMYVPVTGTIKHYEKQHRVEGDANHSSRETSHTVPFAHSGARHSTRGSSPLFTKLRLCVTSQRVTTAPGSLVHTQPCYYKPAETSLCLVVLLPSVNKCCRYDPSVSSFQFTCHKTDILHTSFAELHLQF